MSAQQHAHGGLRRNRRTVIKAAAWTAPAVAVVTAAPALATTTAPPPTGAEISSPNFGETGRGIRIIPIDADYNYTSFANGTTITLTVTGSGTLTGLVVSGGAFSPAITTLTAGTYTILATNGAANFTVRGSMNAGGSLTATASVSWLGPPAGSANTGSVTTAPVAP